MDNPVDFYNKESSQYSKKRYEGQTVTYFQFLFKRRRELFLAFVHQIEASFKDSTALEIGCADGVIVKKLLQKSKESFSSVTGIDVSPKMIEEARATTTDPRAHYFLRGEEPNEKYDLVIELGVHTYDFDSEMLYISNLLHSQGYFIYSLSGKDSIHAHLKLKNKSYLKDYMKYTEYDNIITKYFDIELSEPYGLFVPKLWSIPFLARVVQPLVEMLFKNIFPNLFHEKIYLLQKKSTSNH